MSATTPSLGHDLAGPRSTPAQSPSWLQRLVATSDTAAPAVARLTLGLVMLPHAAQKALGWFGGYGPVGTQGWMTKMLGMPGWLAWLAIGFEVVGTVGLMLGAFTRVAAAYIIAVMVGAIVMVHASNGFFMNWFGAKTGEGFEFHLLAIGLGLVCVMLGGGRASIDRSVLQRRGG